MKYIEIIEKENNKKTKNGFLVKMLSLLLPKANPDFDKKIDLVRIWLLEFENENGLPIREIGLDDKNNVILKMPYKNNYGYWTDNDLTLRDLKKIYNIKTIDKDEFIKRWHEI